MSSSDLLENTPLAGSKTNPAQGGETGTKGETSPPGNHLEEQVEPLISLTLRQAALVLGKSLRALERSLLGKWGNKLPDGWSARKVATDYGYEWRIVPPPGFKVKQVTREAGQPAEAKETTNEGTFLDALLKPQAESKRWALVSDDEEQPTVVIDRSDEIEKLLRELVHVQRALAEERRLHLEDLRLLSQVQGSMRLLEVRAAQTTELKDELKLAQQEMADLKDRYLFLVNMPWWKRLFFRKP